MSIVNPAVVTLVKLATGFVVSSGVSTMVGYAAKSSIPKHAPKLIAHVPVLVKSFHLFQKVAIPAGAAALAGMAADHAVKHVENRIDENVLIMEATKAKIDETVEKASKKASEK